MQLFAVLMSAPSLRMDYCLLGVLLGVFFDLHDAAFYVLGGLLAAADGPSVVSPARPGFLAKAQLEERI